MSETKRKTEGLEQVYEVPGSIEITSDEVDKLEHNTSFNNIYAEYYEQYAEASGEEKYRKNAERLRNCHKSWFGDFYDLQSVFDVKNISLCHDRYCPNCQHLKQAAQLQRFTKILEDAAVDHDLYLMTLTVPNCGIKELKDSLERLSRAFRNIIRYFTGNSKIAGIYFDYYGFYAAYRNIEIVINPDSFHPHYHVVLALKKDLNETKLYTNVYSFSYGSFKRKYSALEILIQKVLYFGYNGIKIDKKRLDDLKQGYSCTIDKIEGNSWHEAFKYATKLTKDGAPRINYYQFEVLLPVLRSMHVGQGYGAWHKLPKDDWDIDSDVLAAYEFVIGKLKEVEDPVGYTYKLLELKRMLHDNSLKCISRKKAYAIVKEWLQMDVDGVPAVAAPAVEDKQPAPSKPVSYRQCTIFDKKPDEDDELPF